MHPFKFAFSILLVIPGALSSVVSSAKLHSQPSVPVPGIFSFGDSLADVGTNLCIENCTDRVDFPPYGETYFGHPVGRYCDGRLWLDFLSQQLNLPLAQAYLKPNVTYEHGANFASGGSGLLDSTNAAENIVPLSTQLEQFLELSAALPELLGDEPAQKLLSQSIYTIISGNNDIGANYLSNSTFMNTTTPADFILLLLEEVQKAVLTFYTAGGRKIVVSGLGPLGCTPASRLSGYSAASGACYDVVNELVLALNTGLKELTDSLTANLTGATIVYAKLYDYMMEIIENGDDYGYVNTTTACCGAGLFNAYLLCGKKVAEDADYEESVCSDPAEYLFWDRSHPTEKTYSLIFNWLWSGNTSAAEPMNLQALAKLKLDSGSAQQA